jgi:hypothetical protein
VDGLPSAAGFLTRLLALKTKLDANWLRPLPRTPAEAIQRKFENEDSMIAVTTSLMIIHSKSAPVQAAGLKLLHCLARYGNNLHGGSVFLSAILSFVCNCSPQTQNA